MQPLHEQSVAELSRLIERRAVSPVEIATSCLDRIEACNAKVNAVVTLQAEQALAEAHAAEAEIGRGDRRSDLHGIPVAHKDLYGHGSCEPPLVLDFGQILCRMRTPLRSRGCGRPVWFCWAS
jgi:Asp-tRNA(Asn)/Glu-tRNA(Gln) amidotransferase A subunit family amidase